MTLIMSHDILWYNVIEVYTTIREDKLVYQYGYKDIIIINYTNWWLWIRITYLRMILKYHEKVHTIKKNDQMIMIMIMVDDFWLYNDIEKLQMDLRSGSQMKKYARFVMKLYDL